MTVQDLLIKPEVSRMHEYFDTREHFARALAYSLKHSEWEDMYSSQGIGIVAGVYAVVTKTVYGTYAQLEPGAIIPIDLKNTELIKSL